jgi:hypothetical protein
LIGQQRVQIDRCLGNMNCTEIGGHVCFQALATRSGQTGFPPNCLLFGLFQKNIFAKKRTSETVFRMNVSCVLAD